MCDCKKHYDPKATCTCYCEHAETFKEVPDEDHIIRGAE